MKGGYVGFDNAFVCSRCEKLYVDNRSSDEIARSIQLDEEVVCFECAGPEYDFTSPCDWCWRPLGQGFLWPLRERKIEAPHKTLKFCDAMCRDLWRDYGREDR